MRHSFKVGFSFGLTSGIITTLGMIIGLHSSTHSKSVVLGGVIIIAVCDAFSDALGIHFSEESENKHCQKEIWEATISTFVSKFMCSLTFVLPVVLLKLNQAIIVSIIWGFFLLIVLSFYIAKEQKVNYKEVILEHLVIATVVIILTHYIGDLVTKLIG